MSARPAPPATSGSLLEVRNAFKSYGDRAALRGVSLNVAEGEIVALLGPNGAGKTTLIRSICGRLSLDDGSVRISGEDPAQSVTARSTLGLVPQELGLYPELTVRENLEVLGRLAGVPRPALGEAVKTALGWTDLAGRAHDRADRLSGGLKRRLNLAAGTLHSPRLLLLDEPTVGVDPGAREVIHGLLRNLRGRGLGILLTTHDLDQAAELADRVVIQTEGRIRAEGTLEELVNDSFGEAREISVRLAEPAPEDGDGVLTEAGLAPTDERRRQWSGALAEGLDSLSSLSARLAESGLHIEELRVREPGLRGVFFKLTGRELET